MNDVAAADGVPAPPPGPGVTPPFPAPPADRSRRGLWIGLGVGALALVLCCGGGLVAFGVIIVNGTDQVKRQSQAAVSRYLGALVDRDYEQAFRLQCPALTAGSSVEAFEAEQRRSPHPVRFTLQDTEVSDTIVVPADITYDTSESRIVRYRVVQNRSTAELRVCGTAR